MKNNYLVILSVIYSLAGFSQPVITSDNYPLAGESFTGYIETSLSSFDPGSSGANQTWDFTSLGGFSAPITYEDPSATDEGASFPTSNIALSQLANYLYYRMTDDSLDIMGTTSQFTSPANIRPNADPQTVITFPFTYNDNFKDTADTGVIPAPTSGTQRRVTYSETTADAYGTLDLPGSTSFSNVLRVLVASKIIDSTWDAGGTFSNESITTDSQYYFISGNYKPHLLVIAKNVNPSGTETLLAQYFTTPSAPTAVLNPVSSYVKIFPNPATTEIRLELDENKFSSTKDVSFQLFNSSGVSVSRKKKIQSNTLNISLSGLKPGIYFYQLKDADKLLESGKIVVE